MKPCPACHCVARLASEIGVGEDTMGAAFVAGTIIGEIAASVTSDFCDSHRAQKRAFSHGFEIGAVGSDLDELLPN